MTDSMTPGTVKRLIREAIKSALYRKTVAAERVFISRSIPTDCDDLPVILIYITGETIDRFEDAPKTYRRDLQVLIECLASGNDDENLELRLEQLADTVEQQLEIDETLGGVADRIELVGTDIQVESGAASPTGNMALRYNVRTYLNANFNEAVDDFEGADIDWKLQEPDDDTVDATDQIDVETI